MDTNLIPVVAIVFGSAVAIAVISGLTSLIKTWINRNKNTLDEEKFDRLARAFIQHRKDSERRLQHIEAVISEEEAIPSSSQPSKHASRARSIEPDDNEHETANGQAARKGKLSNMLNHKKG